MKYLFIGAHPDDIELFCGGTVLRAVEENDVTCLVVTGGQIREGNRLDEQYSAWKKMGVLGMFLNKEDGRLFHNLDLVKAIDDVVGKIKPDIVFSHWEGDHHQDHIAIAKATKSSSRLGFSLITYPSHDINSSFEANLFVEVDMKKKLNLLKVFKSQEDRWYFKDEVIKAKCMATNFGKYVEKFKIEALRI